MKEIKKFNNIINNFKSEIKNKNINNSEEKLILELLYLFLSEKQLISKIYEK